MRKYWNTIRYGTGKARLIVLLSFLCALLAVAGIVATIVFGQALLVFAAIVCVFAGVALMQTLQIDGGADVHMPGADSAGTDMPGADVSQDRTADTAASEDAGIRRRRSRDKRKSKVKKITRKHRDHSVRTEDDLRVPAAETEAASITDGSDNEREAADMMSIMETSDPKHPDSIQTQAEIVPLTEQTIHHYDRRKVKKAMHRYKVRRDHRQILVDRSEKLQIRQTPAYIWIYEREFHLLLIEEQPRHIAIPLYKITGITYLKKQIADEETDYAAFREKSVVADLFRPYLPDYLHTTTTSDLTAYKNLYGASDLFYVTNRSASALFDLLGVEFLVDDRVTMSKKVNIYFKDAYKSNILLRDGVVDANGYADRISRILDNLANSTISYAEFKDTLNLMIRNKLITQEFAMYYMGVRDDLTK